MQRTASVCIKGIKIIKSNCEKYSCGYSSKKRDTWAGLYLERPTSKGETIFVPTSVLTMYIVKVTDSNRPEIDNVADFARRDYENDMNSRLASGWVAGKRRVELCLNSLTCGKCVTAIEITPFDEIYVQVGNEPCAVVRVGNAEKVFHDGDRIEYDDFVCLMTE